MLVLLATNPDLIVDEMKKMVNLIITQDLFSTLIVEEARAKKSFFLYAHFS